ncbi:MAG: hypothetical protein AAFO74_13065 [Pseudomonadota bacterium]
MQPKTVAVPAQPEMDKPDLVRRVRLECRSQIEQHFPPYRQLNALREAILGLRDGRETLEQHEAWIAACKDACDVHEANIAELSDDMIASYDVFSGWPKYDGRKRRKMRDPIASLEAVQHKLDAREVEAKPEEPPAEIADLFESDAYGMEAERLFKLHTDLTSKIVGNMPVTDAERALHSRLTPHVPWLKSRGAVEVL